MRKVVLIAVGLLLALSGCGQVSDGASPPEAAEQSVTGQNSDGKTAALEEGTLSLRPGPKENTTEAVLTAEGKETVLPLTLKNPVEQYTVAPFSDILERSGFLLTQTSGVSFSDRRYYAMEEGKPVLLAKSFGYGEPQDHSVDLDGDGVNELVTNVMYGADGAQRSYVYQSREESIWRGEIDLSSVKDLDDRGANAYATTYNAEKNVFETQYAVKGKGTYALLETRGLEQMIFTAFTDK